MKNPATKAIATLIVDRSCLIVIRTMDGGAPPGQRWPSENSFKQSEMEAFHAGVQPGTWVTKYSVTYLPGLHRSVHAGAYMYAASWILFFVF
jgi:hypothetical protein